MIKTLVGNFHEENCRRAYGIRQTNKLLHKVKQNEKKENNKEKTKYYAQDLKTRKNAAIKSCNAYIRFRDKGKDCICCGRKIKGVPHAGHFKEAGANPIIKFNENNIHLQSSHCNKFKGGDSGDYEKNLRIKIGDRKVDQLIRFKGSRIRGKQLKRTPDDYADIEAYYKIKLKKLKE